MDNKKVVIVTGGSGLLGKAIARHLHAKGTKVINFDLNDNNDASDADFYQCDVTDISSLNTALSSIFDRYGKIDGLVNNAYPRTNDWGVAFEDESYTSIERNIEMQLAAVIHLCQKAGVHMQDGGSIINISSIYGVVGNDPALYEDTEINAPATYSAIKGGLINFTRYLAAKWGHRGVRVNCVSPGGIFNQQDPTFVQRYEKRVPLKRMGTPEDIAPAVGFLLSDEAKYITGHNLVVDGGWTCI